MSGNYKKTIAVGSQVGIVLKKNQKAGNLTRGIVKEILTNSSYHPHGIKVRLEDESIGRVKEIYES